MAKQQIFLKNKHVKPLLILWFLTGVTCLFIFRDFLVGGEFAVFKDAGSDTLQQYIMQYSTIIRHIRDGNFTLWDFSNGFGMNMLGLNVFNPFLMLIYALGVVLGPSRIPALMIYLIILEIFLAGTVMYFYLSEMSLPDGRLSETSRCIAAYMYAFNGYMLVWGQHYQFGGYVVFLPLLLLFMEKTQKSRRLCPGLPILTAVMCMCSVYMTYMTLLAAGIYLIFRTAMQKKTVHCGRLLLFAKTCGGMLLGIGMGMAVFLPGVYYLLNISSRLSSDKSLIATLLSYLRPYESGYETTFFYRLFSSNYLGNASDYSGALNYYEAPVLFFTLLAFLLGFQYLFTIHRQKTSKKNKILQYLILPVLIFFYFVPAGACMFNAFTSPTWRHTFTVMPLLALMTAWTLDQIFIKKQLSLIGLAAAVSALLFVHLSVWKSGTAAGNTAAFCGILGIGMAVLLLAACKISKNFLKNTVVVLLVLCLAANICMEGYWTYNEREVLSKEDTDYFELLYGESMQELLAYLEETDSSFYRVEKDFEAGSYCMDALAQGYYGVSGYNGTQNKNIQQFVSIFWPNLIRIADAEYSYRQAAHETGMASFAGVKYIISMYPDLKDAGLTLVKQFSYLYLYRNDHTDSIARFYANTVSENDFETYAAEHEELDKEELLSDVLILPDEEIPSTSMEDTALELTEIPLVISDFNYEDSSKVSISLDGELLGNYQKIYVEFDLTTDAEACFYFYTDDTERTKYHTNLSEGTHRIRLSLPCGSEVLHFGAYGDSHSGSVQNIRFTGAAASADFTSEEPVSIEQPSRDCRVAASVTAPTDGYLFLAIPFEDGWTAFVDGEEQPILQADYGFSAVAVTEGSHEVMLKFRSPWLLPGCLIAAVCWFIYFTGIFLSRRKRRH